jgi:hypothetical protein
LNNTIKVPVIIFLLCAGSAGALDFGLAVNQGLKTSNETGDPALYYTPVLSPWVSGPLGEQFNLYLSGSIGFEYINHIEDDSAWRDPAALPELDRSELTWLVSPALSVTLGRQRFQDPAGFAASGLFDGFRGNFSAGGSRFSAGAWYTGLLYKDTADIIMTGRDMLEYQKPYALDGGYFASRRALVSFEWDNPGLTPVSSLTLGLLGQFDANGDDDWFHSQYLSVRYSLRLSGGFGLEGTAALGAGESPEETRVFFARAVEGTWTPPGFLDDRLSLRALYSSPTEGERLGAFVPVNSRPQGQVFSPPIGGLSVIRGAYTLRPYPLLSLGAEASYFIRTDTVSLGDQEPGKIKDEGYMLGGELYGTVVWTPLPDLALSAGGGAFFPRLGNAFTDETDIRWKAVLGLILSF